MSSKRRWLTKELSQIYLRGVRGAIPAAGLQFETIRKIAKSWFPRVASVLDLGCGDGVLGRLFLDEYPDARVCFVDFSEPMLDVAQNEDWKFAKGKHFESRFLFSGVAATYN